MAAATDSVGGWRFLFVIAVEDSGDIPFGSHEGLSLEWHLKRGRGGGRGKGGKGVNHKSANPLDRRIALLGEALSLSKFEAFRDRFVVFAPGHRIDAVWSALLLGLPFVPCVLSIDDLFLDKTALFKNRKSKGIP
jgi:hypothetical protein